MSISEDCVKAMKKTDGKLMRNKLCDCVLIVKDEKIAAHKYILSCFSPVFKTMFYGVMASDTVEIPDIDSDEFNQMLEFFYTDELEINSIQNAWSLIYIASKYLIDSLLNLCLKYIEANLCLSNLLLNYEYAEHYNQTNLMKMCWSEIVHYTSGIFDCDYHIKPSTWHLLLEDSLNIDEVELIKHASFWAKEECILQNLKVTTENIWKMLDEHSITQHLPFLTLRPSHYRALTDLFSAKEIALISRLEAQRPKRPKPTLFKLLTEDLKRKIAITTEIRQRVFSLACFEIRECYKIYKNFWLSKNDMLTTGVSVNRKIMLFGLAVSTEHHPSNADSNCYTGGYTIEIFRDKGSKLVVMDKINIPYTLLKYDIVHCVNFPTGIRLDAHVNYIIGIRYNRPNEETRSEVLCHYLGSIERNSVVFTFSNEFSGSGLRGVSFYPL